MSDTQVVTLAGSGTQAIAHLLARYSLGLELVDDETDIPGSYWGDSEAGLIGKRLYARPTTPVHSVLHEAAHFVCMDRARRTHLATDAGGDYDEENAVCYLQIVLGDFLPGFGRERMQRDMDAWGYTFRLGSAAAWFRSDAADALQWLIVNGIVDTQGRPTWSVRQ